MRVTAQELYLALDWRFCFPYRAALNPVRSSRNSQLAVNPRRPSDSRDLVRYGSACLMEVFANPTPPALRDASKQIALS